MADQHARWRHALAGNIIDFGERGDPASGYYRNPTHKGMEAVCIYRDEGGNIQCIRNIFGDGSKMTVDEIDELFGNCGRYPISYELYCAIEGGDPWPDIHTTTLQTKDIKAGVAWTEAWARSKLAADVENYDLNGDRLPPKSHNNPPEDLPPDRALAERIKNVGLQVAAWLEKIGGKPRNLEEAELLGKYGNKFKDFENEAVAAHKAEKEPHLKAGREVDAKWFAPVRDKAIASREKIIGMIRLFEKEEDAKCAEAARAANEEAQKIAAAQAQHADTTPEPAATFTPEPTKVSSLRGGTRRATEPLIVDLKEFLAYCASLKNPPPDILEAAEKVAKKWCAAGVQAPGMSQPDRKSA